MTGADEAAVLAFAQALPRHDLLFLPRDITQPKILAAWTHELECGTLTSLLALRAGTVLGCATIVCDPLSWSAHVGEIRVVVAAETRGSGVGRRIQFDRAGLQVQVLLVGDHRQRGSRGVRGHRAFGLVDGRCALAVGDGSGHAVPET